MLLLIFGTRYEAISCRPIRPFGTPRFQKPTTRTTCSPRPAKLVQALQRSIVRLHHDPTTRSVSTGLAGLLYHQHVFRYQITKDLLAKPRHYLTRLATRVSLDERRSRPVKDKGPRREPPYATPQKGPQPPQRPSPGNKHSHSQRKTAQEPIGGRTSQTQANLKEDLHRIGAP